MQPISSHWDRGVPLVLLGINGPSYAGKNDIANVIVPPASQHVPQSSDNGLAITWSNVSFTLPLKGIYRDLISISGKAGRDRKLYAVHSELVSLFGQTPLSGAPSYDDLVGLTYEIVDYPLNESVKTQRDFMQWAGNKCRELVPECFVSNARQQIMKEQSKILSEWSYVDEDEVLPMAHVVLIPDARLKIEGQFIHDSYRSYIVHIEVDEQTAKKSALELDDAQIYDNQLQDITEVESRNWPKEWIDHHVNISHINSISNLATDIMDGVTDYIKRL